MNRKLSKPDRTLAVSRQDEIPARLERDGSVSVDGLADRFGVLVIGKGLGGGVLPIAAVIADPGLDVGGDWAFGHYTHEKNPVTTPAAPETIRIIEDENLVANAARVGALALARLDGMMDRCPSIGDVRGRGCFIGVELVRDRATREPNADLAEAVLCRALDAGLSFKTTMGNVLTLTPPLTVTPEQMANALDIVEAAIVDMDRVCQT